MRKRSQQGFTLVEVLAGSAILMINLFALTSIWLSVKSVMTRIQKTGNKEILINNFTQDVKVQVDNYQMFFDHDREISGVPLPGGTEYAASYLKPENLGLVWNGISVYDRIMVNDGVETRCENCPGLMGFVIQPFSHSNDQAQWRGLYRVKLRQMHTELLLDDTKEFIFVSR